MRKRCPVTGMIVNSRSLGSRASTAVRIGTPIGEFHISMKSAPMVGPRIGWCCGGGPSETTMDFPFSSWPVTMRRVGSVIRLTSCDVAWTCGGDSASCRLLAQFRLDLRGQSLYLCECAPGRRTLPLGPGRLELEHGPVKLAGRLSGLIVVTKGHVTGDAQYQGRDGTLFTVGGLRVRRIDHGARKVDLRLQLRQLLCRSHVVLRSKCGSPRTRSRLVHPAATEHRAFRFHARKAYGIDCHQVLVPDDEVSELPWLESALDILLECGVRAVHRGAADRFLDRDALVRAPDMASCIGAR